MIRLLLLSWIAMPVSLCWGSGGSTELQRHTRVRDFLSILGKEPDSAQVLRDAALRAGRMGEVGVCRELFLEGAHRFPDRAGWLYHELGEAMSRMGKEAAAAAAYRKALEKRSGLRVSYGYYALANLHERKGEVAKAWKVYEELMEDEEALSIHVVEAAAFAKRHALKDAERCFELALKMGIKEGAENEARVLRRWAGLQTGGEALVLYRRLHAGKHTQASDFQRAGEVAAQMKLEVPCEEFFAEGMNRHSDMLGWLRYEFAEQLETFGRNEEALELYRQAKKDPLGLKISYAYLGLAKILEKMGELKEATLVFEELAGDDEAKPAHLAEAGNFEARQGRIDRSLALHLQAFQRAKDHDEQIEVGNVFSEGLDHLPDPEELTAWFRMRTEAFSEEERRRLRLALATTWGNRAWHLLNEGEFGKAGTAAEMALVIYDPEILKWVEGNRAHAYVFLGRIAEAREIHERYQGQDLELEGFDWERAAKEDFEIFREKGLVSEQAEVELQKLERFLGIR